VGKGGREMLKGKRGRCFEKAAKARIHDGKDFCSWVGLGITIHQRLRRRGARMGILKKGGERLTSGLAKC